MTNIINNNDGFTLIELIIVIFILGVLSVAAAPRFINLSDDANRAVVVATKGAFQQAVGLSHVYWQIRGNRGAVVRLSGLYDGSVNFNTYGYPIDSADRKRAENSTIKSVNQNMCGRVWNNLLDYSPALDISGSGERGADGTHSNYYSVDNGLFKLLNVSGNSCVYSFVEDNTIRIHYASQTGKVTVVDI